MNFPINRELLMVVQSAHESYNTYLVAKKEIEMKAEKERAKKWLEENSEQVIGAELDHLNSKFHLKQNNQRTAVESIVIGNKFYRKQLLS